MRVEIYGLRDFQMRLRRADAMLPRQLKRGFDEIGREILEPAAKQKMQKAFVGYQTGRLERSLRTRSTQREGRVLLGKAAVPYAGWWEFGGHTGSPRGDTRREFVSGGRTLYPAFKEHYSEVMNAAKRVIDVLAVVFDA